MDVKYLKNMRRSRITPFHGRPEEEQDVEKNLSLEAPIEGLQPIEFI